MKRKFNFQYKSNAKRRKKQHYLFFESFSTNTNTKLEIILYDINNRKFIVKDINFTNWFYSTKLNTNPYVERFELKKNVLLSSGETIAECYKIYYNCREVFKFYDRRLCYESNIPNSVRFLTTKNLKFLDVVDEFLVHTTDDDIEWKIPIYLFDDYNNVKRYVLGEDLILKDVTTTVKNPPRNSIVMVWKKQPQIKNCFFIKVYELCFGFLRLLDEMHENRIKLQPDEIFELKYNKRGRRFEIMDKVVKTYFIQFLIMAGMIPIPVKDLLRMKNRTLISEHIFLSNNNINNINNLCNIDSNINISNEIVCSPPKGKVGFSSHAFRYLEKAHNLYIGEFTGLDFDSMYPSVMLILFKKNLHLLPYYNFVKSFLVKKRIETNPHKRYVYKITLNSIYGSLSSVYKYIASQSKEAEEIGKISSKILQDCVAHFGIENVIHCNTDSIFGILPTNDYCKEGFILKEEYKTKKVIFLNQNVKILDGKCVGLTYATSVTVPRIIRSKLKCRIFEVLEKAETYEEFYNELFLSEYVPELDSEITLEDLLFMNKKGEFWVYLYSVLDKERFKMGYGRALDLVDDVNQEIWPNLWKYYLNKTKSYFQRN